MAHLGSVLVTSTKALWASSYQNECSRETARLNCCCAAPLQDTVKLTWPSFSPISCLCCSGSCAFGVSETRRRTRDTPRKNLLSFITVSISNALIAYQVSARFTRHPRCWPTRAESPAAG